jgi:hypothetical protein
MIKPIIDLVAADWVAEAPTDLQPEEGLKALLQVPALSTADDRAALETSMEECRTMLSTATSPCLKKMLQEQLDREVVALAKLTKRVTPSLATQLAALQEAEKTLLKQTSERRDKETRGRHKASERAATRAEFFAEARRQLTIVEQAVAAHEEQWASVHTAKSQTLDGYERIMLARLQTRIASSESPDSVMAADEPPGQSAEELVESL